MFDWINKYIEKLKKDEIETPKQLKKLIDEIGTAETIKKYGFDSEKHLLNFISFQAIKANPKRVIISVFIIILLVLSVIISKALMEEIQINGERQH